MDINACNRELRNYPTDVIFPWKLPSVKTMSNSSADSIKSEAAAKLNRITEDALCIGCGICQSIAGEEAITLELVESGNYRPVARPCPAHSFCNCFWTAGTSAGPRDLL